VVNHQGVVITTLENEPVDMAQLRGGTWRSRKTGVTVENGTVRGVPPRGGGWR
jgi:hypothetical protein